MTKNLSKLKVFGVLSAAILLAVVTFQNCSKPGITRIGGTSVAGSSNTPATGINSTSCTSKSWKSSNFFYTSPIQSDGGVSAPVMAGNDLYILKNAGTLQGANNVVYTTRFYKYSIASNSATEVSNSIPAINAGETCVLDSYFNIETNGTNRIVAQIRCTLNNSNNVSIAEYNTATNSWSRKTHSSFSVVNGTLGSIDFKFSELGNLFLVIGVWNSSAGRYDHHTFKETNGVLNLIHNTVWDTGYMPSLIVDKNENAYLTMPKEVRNGSDRPMLKNLSTNQMIELAPVGSQWTPDSVQKYTFNNSNMFYYAVPNASAMLAQGGQTLIRMFDFTSQSITKTLTVNNSVYAAINAMNFTITSNLEFIGHNFAANSNTIVKYNLNNNQLISSENATFSVGTNNYSYVWFFPITTLSGDFYASVVSPTSTYINLVRAYNCN